MLLFHKIYLLYLSAEFPGIIIQAHLFGAPASIEYYGQCKMTSCHIGNIYLDYKHYPELALEHYAAALGKTVDPAMKEKVKMAMESLPARMLEGIISSP